MLVDESRRVHTFTVEMLDSYVAYLRGCEKNQATVEKYQRNIMGLFLWLQRAQQQDEHGKGEVSEQTTSSTTEYGQENSAPIYIAKENILAWREHLLQSGHTPGTVNGMLSAVNGLFKFLGWEDCRVKFLKVQRRLFRDRSRQLTKDEYQKLLDTAEGLGKHQLALVMETICATGIRVSELQYITAEAARRSSAEISLKGKIRTILLPGKLCNKLRKYMKGQHITTGPVFCTRSGKPLSRCQIWAQMKALCKAAGVEGSKVFPHNLRHLFAMAFYKVYKDVVRLADVLGHSSIETTRIYLITTGEEYSKQLDRLGLVQ